MTTWYVPEGFALVPLEMTDAMMDAAEAVEEDWGGMPWREVWAEILAAAPVVKWQPKIGVEPGQQYTWTDEQKAEVAGKMSLLFGKPKEGE